MNCLLSRCSRQSLLNTIGGWISRFVAHVRLFNTKNSVHSSLPMRSFDLYVFCVVYHIHHWSKWNRIWLRMEFSVLFVWNIILIYFEFSSNQLNNPNCVYSLAKVCKSLFLLWFFFPAWPTELMRSCDRSTTVLIFDCDTIGISFTRKTKNQAAHRKTDFRMIFASLWQWNIFSVFITIYRSCSAYMNWLFTAKDQIIQRE